MTMRAAAVATCCTVALLLFMLPATIIAVDSTYDSLAKSSGRQLLEEVRALVASNISKPDMELPCPGATCSSIMLVLQLVIVSTLPIQCCHSSNKSVPPDPSSAADDGNELQHMLIVQKPTGA
jgi:hypothetical protein